jgi:hypothetical protein
LYNCHWISTRHYPHARYKQCNCGCNQPHSKCNLLYSNESSAGTSGCNGGILLKIHNFHWSHTSTKDANVVVIGKHLRSTTWKKNVTSGCI